MLREATPLSRSLSGAVIDDDAALLLYAPAGGLTLTLVTLVFLDVFASRIQDPGVLLGVLGGAAMTTAWVIHRAAHDARGCLPLIISRFREVDTPTFSQASFQAFYQKEC